MDLCPYACTVILCVFITNSCVVFAPVSLQEDYDYEYVTYDYPQPLNCSTTESIKGGHVSYSQVKLIHDITAGIVTFGGLEGSVLTYHCGPGQYPYPVSSRLCGADGDWAPMRLPNGRSVSRATCKDVLCSAQLQLDHGEFWPRDQWFHVGVTQSFSCQEGFTLFGSAQRNCTLSGEWTGSTPVCDNHADDCNDPGVPPGAERSAGRFHVGEKVVYRCQAGLDLLGSAERVCLENKEWSGSTPRCQGPSTFDSPSFVAEAMAGSLAGVMDVFSPDLKRTSGYNFGRTIRVDQGSRMNVYILLDTSGSIKPEDFEISRNATIALIKKLDSYEVQMKFHVLSFATNAIDIINITEMDISSSIDEVIYSLLEFNYNSHGRKTGTNLHAALHRVYQLMSFFKQNSATNHFNETQNIIIIETDGYSNTGNKPQIALAQIRHLLGYSTTSPDHTDERMLDVYIFGIGNNVKKEELNSLASQKRGEQHLFILKDFETLGVPQWGRDRTCSGSILNQNWVLTAAHCFARVSTVEINYQVDIEHGGGIVKSNKVIMHHKYNVYALKHRNVSEFYDYDVALVQLNKSIPLSWKARSLGLISILMSTKYCVINVYTVKELVPQEEMAVYFIHKNSDRKKTHIHTGKKRHGCVEKARQTLTEPSDVTLDEYTPDRFLCSGGSSGHQDAISCKGDSGGSLFLKKRQRYFQVSKSLRRYSTDKPPPDARDFHINLFEIMPWLKQHLGEEIQFLQGVD
uniref:C3/C5 convertase n=1 Tax=Mastacembelus armatus TaxID=205130 RepID=A0A7N8WNE2_9TELE